MVSTVTMTTQTVRACVWYVGACMRACMREKMKLNEAEIRKA